MTLRVTPLGGLGEIGLNCMLFDDGGSALLIDAGLLFPDDTMLGVDYVVPDFSVLRETSPHLGALLLTHGHEDHIGAVPFLLREFDIPVYGTRLTLGLLRHRLAEHGLEASSFPFPGGGCRAGAFLEDPCPHGSGDLLFRSSGPFLR